MDSGVPSVPIAMPTVRDTIHTTITAVEHDHRLDGAPRRAEHEQRGEHDLSPGDDPEEETVRPRHAGVLTHSREVDAGGAEQQHRHRPPQHPRDRDRCGLGVAAPARCAVDSGRSSGQRGLLVAIERLHGGPPLQDGAERSPIRPKRPLPGRLGPTGCRPRPWWLQVVVVEEVVGGPPARHRGDEVRHELVREHRRHRDLARHPDRAERARHPDGRDRGAAAGDRARATRSSR